LLRRTFIALALAGAVTGCAFGVKQQYETAQPNVSARSQKLALAVLDHRPYVIDGNKTETFTGLSRGGYGNPFDINTGSGQPLATDMAQALARALTAKGATVTVIPLPPSTTEVQAMAKLAAAGKGVLVTLIEWKSDTYFTTALHYDLRTIVVDGTGRLLGVHAMQGADNLGGGLGARDTGPVTAFNRKMEEVFTAPQVAGAL
jgi:hypothetical protein